jgi:hypothetical protein
MCESEPGRLDRILLKGVYSSSKVELENPTITHYMRQKNESVNEAESSCRIDYFDVDENFPLPTLPNIEESFHRPALVAQPLAHQRTPKESNKF